MSSINGISNDTFDVEFETLILDPRESKRFKLITGELKLAIAPLVTDGFMKTRDTPDAP